MFSSIIIWWDWFCDNEKWIVRYSETGLLSKVITYTYAAGLASSFNGEIFHILEIEEEDRL